MVGHHMIFDLAYVYSQFIDALPDSYVEFADGVHKHFPAIYDTRSIAVDIYNSLNEKTELNYLYSRILKDKKFANNVTIVLDKEKDPKFGAFLDPKTEQIEGQDHDAGFDSYMTGHIFASFTKYIEIGKVIGIVEGGQ